MLPCLACGAQVDPQEAAISALKREVRLLRAENTYLREQLFQASRGTVGGGLQLGTERPSEGSGSLMRAVVAWRGQAQPGQGTYVPCAMGAPRMRVQANLQLWRGKGSVHGVIRRCG